MQQPSRDQPRTKAAQHTHGMTACSPASLSPPLCCAHPHTSPTPCSGLPMINRATNAVYGEVEALVTLLGYKTQNAGCCKVGTLGLPHSAAGPQNAKRGGLQGGRLAAALSGMPHSAYLVRDWWGGWWESDGAAAALGPIPWSPHPPTPPLPDHPAPLLG